LTGRYYLADRSNGAIDVVDITTNKVTSQISGFVGFRGSNSTSGPDGVVVTAAGKELWAGDGDSTVKVVDLTAGKIAASISTGGKKRTDELAYDPKDQLILIANNADDPAFASFISTTSRQVLGKINYPDATDGVEQPWYDSATGMFYLAVPGTKQNEGGQIDVIDPMKMTVTNSYLMKECTPHGLTTGPGKQLLAGCNAPNHAVILDKTNGSVLADVTQAHGVYDEVWFNWGDSKYYLATADQTLSIIDAMTMTLVGERQAGVNSHSVAADSVTNHVFVPVASPDPSCPSGCIAVFASVLNDKTMAPRQ
jgi:DNA-binding beta-propeller fold protein YncE